MASLVSSFFNKTPANEQSLIQKLTNECIQIAGVTCYYLPRQLQTLDVVLGEDVLSKFNISLPIEMYIESNQSWGGDSELMSKFGLEIRNQIELTVSAERWTTEVATISQTNMWVTARPQEGDLIYDSITKKLFEIKFVDQNATWYQLGKMAYVYKMKCEMFQYNNEKIETGISDIDSAVAAVNKNLFDLQLLQENGSLLLQEMNDSIFLNVPSLDRVFDTTKVFKEESDIMNFNVENPFADL